MSGKTFREKCKLCIRSNALTTPYHLSRSAATPVAAILIVAGVVATAQMPKLPTPLPQPIRDAFGG